MKRMFRTMLHDLFLDAATGQRNQKRYRVANSGCQHEVSAARFGTTVSNNISEANNADKDAQ
eukprot:6432756-Lingulodinium_polyedra.AAC.1